MGSPAGRPPRLAPHTAACAHDPQLSMPPARPRRVPRARQLPPPLHGRAAPRAAAGAHILVHARRAREADRRRAGRSCVRQRRPKLRWPSLIGGARAWRLHTRARGAAASDGSRSRAAAVRVDSASKDERGRRGRKALHHGSDARPPAAEHRTNHTSHARARVRGCCPSMCLRDLRCAR